MILYETSASYFVRYSNYPGIRNWFDYSVNEAAISIRNDSSTQAYLVVVDDSLDPETHSVIQTFRYLTNFKMDAATKNNIIRLRDLSAHADRHHAIVFSPSNLKHRVQKILGGANRVKTY